MQEALRVFLALHIEKSNQIFPMFYFCVCILCIYKKRQTNLEVCFINNALIDCLLFLPAGERETAFQAAHLEKLGWCLCLERALHLHHPGWDPWQQPPHKLCSHPLRAAPFLVGTRGRKVMRRSPVEVKHTRTSGGEDSMKAGSHGRMVGHTGELDHVPSPFRRRQRVTVMCFCGSALKCADEKPIHKG